MELPRLEYFVLVWSFIGLALFSNTGVLCFTLKSSQLRQKPSVIYMNGAIANVIYCIIIVVFAVQYEFSPSQEVCKVFDYFGSFFSNITVLTVTVVSLDKYCAVMKPFIYRSHGKVKNALLVIALLYGLSAILTIPRIVNLSVNDVKRFCPVNSTAIRRPLQASEVASEMTTLLLVFLLPCFIYCAIYGRLIHRLWFSKQDVQTTDLALLKSRRNITKLAVMATLFFMLCWLPYCITSAWWCWSIWRPQYMIWLDNYSLVFIGIYTGLSPILFALHNESIRREMNRKFSCFTLKRVNVEEAVRN